MKRIPRRCAVGVELGIEHGWKEVTGTGPRGPVACRTIGHCSSSGQETRAAFFHSTGNLNQLKLILALSSQRPPRAHGVHTAA